MKRLIAAFTMAALALPVAAMGETQITAVGSTALLPLVKQAAAKYQTEHSDVKISVSGGGSFVGIAQASSGAADMGDSDVIAPGNAGLKDHKVAVVGFDVIVHPGAGITNLSSKQVRDIFAGRVTNWNQVGGKDQQIVVINRPRTSGTRFVFKATMMGTSTIAEGGLIEDSSGTVTTTVANTPGAVTYVARAYVEGKPVTAVSIDHVQPTVDNIRNGKWKIWSYEHVFTKGTGKPEVENFISFIANDTEDLEKLGYVTLKSMKVKELGR